MRGRALRVSARSRLVAPVTYPPRARAARLAGLSKHGKRRFGGLHADPHLDALVDAALSGNADALERYLLPRSGLPGKNLNEAVARAFARCVAARAPNADRLAIAWLEITELQAPELTVREYLPVAGAIALGERAAHDASVRKRFVQLLLAHADDERGHVRSGIAIALRDVGERDPEGVLALGAFEEGDYYGRVAWLRALDSPRWLGHVTSETLAVSTIDDAFESLEHAPRASTRYPGYRELVRRLPEAAIAVAARFPEEALAVVERWASSAHPDIREVVGLVARDRSLRSRNSEALDRVCKTLETSAAPVRDPRHVVPGTRKRGKKRR